MPIYDYKCSKCEHQFELIQKFSDQPAEVCPECSKKSIQKLVSAPSFRLKGRGWYETDFKTGNKKNIAKSDNDSQDNKKNSEKNKPAKEKIEAPSSKN